MNLFTLGDVSPNRPNTSPLTTNPKFSILFCRGPLLSRVSCAFRTFLVCRSSCRCRLYDVKTINDGNTGSALPFATSARFAKVEKRQDDVLSDYLAHINALDEYTHGG